jgi:Fusaric acid resistance protein-like
MKRPWWHIRWSVPAAMRAVRATVVIPAIFALTYKVVQDPQMALFAVFGGFATLVIAGFGGTRRDKLIAHFGLAVAGSVVLVIGTFASGTAWIAAIVTIPVVFVIYFSGVVGPNAASGTTAALFAYVLPVASVGGAATIPSRLEGWWLAAAAGTLAVLLLSPRTAADRLRAAAAELADEIANRVRAAADGQATDPTTMRAAKEKLWAAFTATSYRPTGLATADQALASAVQFLDWAGAQVGDAFDGHVDMISVCQADRDLLATAADMFSDVNALLTGRDASPDFDALVAARARSARRVADLTGRAGEPDARVAAAQAVHAQEIAVTAGSAAADALIAARRADPATIARERRVWSGLTATDTPIPNDSSRLSVVPAALTGAGAVVRRHATIRSVWFVSSLRGALAVAAAVAVADVSGVQHGFWIVLGTLSVLRTNATSTGSTAWRALAGTTVGFAVGAALLIGIGTAPRSLWVALPLAILVAAYAPGTMPFAIGQAAFTVTIVVLFNLLSPVGWQVGLLRVEDVAIGCAVSLVVGLLFWPRGAAAVVAGDLADAFRDGAAYLTQAVDWALSELTVPPAATAAAVAAATRLDDALRGFLAEQGSKRVRKEDLWTLVMATARLRLTATTLAGLRDVEVATGVAAATVPEGPGEPAGLACVPLTGSDTYTGSPACTTLRTAAAGLAGFYGQVADEVGRAGRGGELTEVPPPPVTGAVIPRTASTATLPLHHPHLLWVQDHLHHLSESAQTVSGPALRVAEARRRPWWR